MSLIKHFSDGNSDNPNYYVGVEHEKFAEKSKEVDDLKKLLKDVHDDIEYIQKQSMIDQRTFDRLQFLLNKIKGGK